jgi:EAL and modified HD-GYP domain-containing signal transduction protein
VIISLFNEMGVQSVLGKERGFINVSAEFLMSDMIELLPTGQIVIELLETIEITPLILEQCRKLKQNGFSLALDDFAIMHDQYIQLLPIVDVIKVDLMQLSKDDLTKTSRKLREYPAKLLAEKVETREQFEHCKQLGFHFFQGYYFAKPVILTGKRVEPSTIALFKLLSLVLDDASSEELEGALKGDSNLTYNLLKMVNSVGSGASQKIDTLAKAIMVIGRRQLQRWLQLLLYSGASSSAPVVNPLLQLAATRGRLMELLVDRTPDVKAGGRDLIDQAFMVGILSLMPTLIGTSMSEILAQLPLAKPVQEALGERRGVLGDLLVLIESLEEESREKAGVVLQRLPDIDAAYANNCLMRALTWANNLARESS